MNRYGFTIFRLRAEDTTTPPAEVPFRPGLNVIAGDSNTGKSYIRQCLDFMLGSNTLPKSIDEAKPYASLFLEIKDREGNDYTLERSLKGGELHLYSVPFNKITSVIPRILTTKDTNTLSAFLLALCGISAAKIRVNDRGKTEALTFRTMRHLFVIDENTIISESPPIQLPVAQVQTKTKARALFNYLLTGKDDSSLIALPDRKIERAQQEAKKEIYDELISALENELAEQQIVTSDIQEEINRLKGGIESVTQKISSSQNVILEHQRRRQENWKLQKEQESRIIVIDELLKRFELLRQHYHSDLERLEFIIEGDHLFDQLVSVFCPVCGSSLEEHSRKRMCLTIDGEPESLMNASREEAAKINTHLHDLEGTVSELKQEREGLVRDVTTLRELVSASDNQIRNELNPKQATDQDELERLLSTRNTLSKLEVNMARLQELKTAREAVQKPSSVKLALAKLNPASEGRAITQSLMDRSALRRLGDTIEDILGRWKYADNGTVEFDEQTMDFIVNGKARINNGKGVRALIHSAIAIGLMRFCKENNLPHPGFVILDSPLTTLREGPKDVISGEDVSGEIQKAFFENLADTPQDEQIIILENKVPPEDVRSRINYLEFRKEGEGREGFYPVVT